MRKMYSEEQINRIVGGTGTKLYLHNITLSGQFAKLILVSTESQPFVVESLNIAHNAGHILSALIEDRASAKCISCCLRTDNVSEQSAIGISYLSDETSWSATTLSGSFTDNVTAL